MMFSVAIGASILLSSVQDPQKPIKGDSPAAPPVVLDIADVRDTLMVRMTVGGVQGLFAVDTGSFDILITPEFAKSAKLPVSDEDGKKTTTLPFDYGAVKLALPAEVRPIGVTDSGEPGGFKIAGFLGLSAFRHRCMGIDTVNHKLSLWPTTALTDKEREFYFSNIPYRVPGEGVMWARPGADFNYKGVHFLNRPGPLKVHKATLESRDSDDEDDSYRIASAINGKPVSLVFDTGSGASMLRKSLTNWGNVVDLGTITAHGIDKNWQGQVAMGDMLAFDEQRVYAPKLLLVPDDFPVEGLVGYDALEGMRVLLELDERELSIGKDPTVTDGESGLLPFGLRLIAHNETVYLGVVPGSPADKAGFESGDILVSLANESAGQKPEPVAAAPSDDDHPGRWGVTARFSGSEYPLAVRVVAKRKEQTISRLLKRKPGRLYQMK